VTKWKSPSAGLFRRVIGTAIAKGTAVPIIRKQESSKRPGAAEGAESSILVGVDQGSQSLHIEEVSVAPNARIPRRINPHTEVAI
jgi:quercetin dioxygenase-like cupin family protein